MLPAKRMQERKERKIRDYMVYVPTQRILGVCYMLRLIQRAGYVRRIDKAGLSVGWVGVYKYAPAPTRQPTILQWTDVHEYV